ncbi:hypothetical protein [Nocardioides bruguierae]|uniref:Uncharacterized protein n=1 Tax=Nocardioides bruguierae TaxID=2945102 RepID=A0A9X2IDK4_9ACTN|nr:hypothetical protein [Nocardioides bruguierae]MCL8024954.1 hypothetical protein [Nocardioides bruguierae]MCM0619357.1 hypothetical protein [Nocardioides bruguierae]
MAWEDELFTFLDDLEQQAEAAYAAERGLELADRARAEYASVALAGRLMASVGCEVGLRVEGIGRLRGTLDRVADGWLLLSGPAQDWVVRLPALLGVDGASERAVPDVAWPAASRLGLGSALRRLADAGERCVLHLRDAARHEGVVLRVGADFVELAEGEARRVLLVPCEALAAVSSSER